LGAGRASTNRLVADELLDALSPEIGVVPGVVLARQSTKLGRIRLAFKVVELDLRQVPAFEPLLEQPQTEVGVLVIALDVQAA
jgi:hypothetical protein